MRPLRRRNLSEEIAEALAGEIGRGRLKPGERLPSERELSDAFAVGRSSVREAIKALQSRGLVEGRPGGGTYVRRPGVEDLVQLPAAAVSVTEAEVLALYEVREMLDPGIARLAAERARRADIAALTRMLERQETLVDDGRYTSEDDAGFHLRLARISANPVLIRLMDGVMRLLGEAREPALRARGRRVRLEGHWQILRAVEAHDADAAAEAALAHLHRARDTALTAVRALELDE